MKKFCCSEEHKDVQVLYKMKKFGCSEEHEDVQVLYKMKKFGCSEEHEDVQVFYKMKKFGCSEEHKDVQVLYKMKKFGCSEEHKDVQVLYKMKKFGNSWTIKYGKPTGAKITALILLVCSNRTIRNQICLYWRRNIETNEKARRPSLATSSFSSYKQHDGCNRNLTNHHAINDYGLFRTTRK